MTDRLTAEKARDLARAKDPSFAVYEILAGIEAAARDGKYEYITREYGFGDGACYGNEDKWPALCQAVIKELRKLGFSTRVRVLENQFVDLWLEVKWVYPRTYVATQEQEQS